MDGYDYSGDESSWESSSISSTHKVKDGIQPNECYSDFYNEFIKLMGEIYPVVPKEYIMGAAVFLVSAVIGKNVRCSNLNIGGKKKPHILVMLLGPSTGSHKTTMIEVVNSILMEIEDDVHIHAGRFSSEQMFSDLSKNPTGVIIKDEFTTVFDESAKKHNSDIKTFLTHLFDGWMEDRSTRARGLETARDVSISMLCATVPSLLSSKLEPSDFSGGFLPRFLFFVSVEQSKFMPIRRMTNYDTNRLQKVIKTLKFIHDKYSIGNIGTYFSDDALMMFEDWMKENSNPKTYKSNIVTAEMRPFFGRLVDYVLKLCIIFKCSCIASNYNTDNDGNKTIMIDAVVMKRAIDFINEYKEKMLPLVSTLLHDTDISRVYNRIKDMCNASEFHHVTKSNLLRSLGILAYKLDAILETLEISELITIERKNNISDGKFGRMKHIIKLTGVEDKVEDQKGDTL